VTESSFIIMATMTVPPEQYIASLPSIVDRTSKQEGATKLANPNFIAIKYNAELEDASCCFKCSACVGCLPYTHCVLAPACSYFDKERSYLYLREGSLESNTAMDNFCKPICCCCSFDDNVKVSYFDRDPYAIQGCCCPSVPKLEILDPGYMCCCVKLDCECIFGPKQVVIMPFESCCMGLCANRTNCCHNTCGLCGAPNGNPIIFNTFYPQPKNAEPFVAQAKQIIPVSQRMEGHSS